MQEALVLIAEGSGERSRGTTRSRTCPSGPLGPRWRAMVSWILAVVGDRALVPVSRSRRGGGGCRLAQKRSRTRAASSRSRASSTCFTASTRRPSRSNSSSHHRGVGDELLGRLRHRQSMSGQVRGERAAQALLGPVAARGATGHQPVRNQPLPGWIDEITHAARERGLSPVHEGCGSVPVRRPCHRPQRHSRRRYAHRLSRPHRPVAWYGDTS